MYRHAFVVNLGP